MALPAYSAVIAPSAFQPVFLDITILTLSGSGLTGSGKESHVFLPIITVLNPSPSVSLLNRAISLDNLHGSFCSLPMYPSSSIATIIAIFILTTHTEISALILS